MSLANAFSSLLSLQSKKVTIERPGKFTAVEISMSPSSYSRNLAGPSDVAIEGREYVITRRSLDDAGFPAPKRGDRITDPDTGLNMITEVHEMYDLGAGVMGYRIRVG